MKKLSFFLFFGLLVLVSLAAQTTQPKLFISRISGISSEGQNIAESLRNEPVFTDNFILMSRSRGADFVITGEVSRKESEYSVTLIITDQKNTLRETSFTYWNTEELSERISSVARELASAAVSDLPGLAGSSASASGGALKMPQMSIGLGAHFTADFWTFVPKDSSLNVENMNSHLVGGGFYGFFDMKYIEANLGFLFGSFASDANTDINNSIGISALKLGLFGKLPLNIDNLNGASSSKNTNIIFFPMAGIDGQIFLGGKSGSVDVDKSYGNQIFNQFWVKAGAGLDVPLAQYSSSDRFYLRVEFLYGIRFNTEWEQDLLKPTTYSEETLIYDDGDFDTETIFHTRSSMFNAIIGHGFDIRLAFGYKF